MIGCVIAMESEAEILRDAIQKKSVQTVFGKAVELGTVFGKEIALVVCGVGKVNAAVGACAALHTGADVIFNFGVAGGLLPNRTEVGRVYAIDKAVQYDFDLTQLNGGEVGTLDGETENFLPLYIPAALESMPCRTLASGDRFNDSPVDHNLLVRLGADIRDMEGAAIAEVCKYAGKPFAAVKAISDVYGAGSTTEQFQNNLRLACGNLKAQMKKIMESF